MPQSKTNFRHAYKTQSNCKSEKIKKKVTSKCRKICYEKLI